ncbi:PUA-like domain containing protein [Parasponia andersonii]|uniref:Protein cereblon n=1 Tax=Parasponia andersonii TaxID=3476 RepID=A0A2P5D3I8_PARAD|nr:PUA-like domain containing protein [Parasponia andersonii]
MADASISERERHQIEQILELDLEELLVEEVDSLHDSSDDDRHATGRGYDGAGTSSGFTFNTCLASLHTYLGDVEDTHHRLAFLEGGAILNLPMFYLEGVVLFPEATLPLRVIEANFIAAIERALTQVDVPFTIGVVRAHRNRDNGRTSFSTVGTTAEIRQYRRLEDGSLNVVTRGQQRFRLRRRWIDAEGVPCGEIQIIQEDLPLRTPQDAFGDRLPSNASCAKPGGSRDGKDSEENSDESFESSLSLTERKVHQSAIVSCSGYDTIDESASSDDDKSEFQFQRAHHESESDESLHSEPENGDSGFGNSSISRLHSVQGKQRISCSRNSNINQLRRVPRTFWPFWVYRMYDSYCLAQKAADMWKQIVGAPSMEGLVKKPDLLSFYIASKIPVSESTRQELLEIDGISYRLRREIELLESVDLIRCRNCQAVIARRSDMLVMSSDGPLGAYVNPHGFVHEVMTLYRAFGLALIGPAVREYSWFPGYAWTITNCASCETQMGWLFSATNKNLKPRLFWGIRSSQVSENTR